MPVLEPQSPEQPGAAPAAPTPPRTRRRTGRHTPSAAGQAGEAERIEAELAAEAEAQEQDLRAATASAGQRGRPSPKRGVPSARAGTAAAGAAGAAAAAKRGFPLALKFIAGITVLVLIVSIPFGLVMISIFKARLEAETQRNGRNLVLALRGPGKRFYDDFRSPAAGKGDTKTYNASEGGKAALAELKRIADADPLIRDISVLCSDFASENPSKLVLSPLRVKSYSPPPSDAKPDAQGVLVWNGGYEGESGGGSAILFRAGIEGGPERFMATVFLILSREAIEAQAASLANKVIIFGLVFLGIGIGLSLFLASAVTKPVETLLRDMDTVAGGDLDHVTQPQTRDEIGLLALSFNEMTRGLREARDREREVNRLNSEVSLAKEIHAKLLPDKLPNIPGYDIFTAYACAKEVGGDYYDYFGVSLDKGLLGFVVADVSGKGIPGSMVMGNTRIILRMLASENPSPADVLSKTNYHIARDIKRGMFVTMVYFILDVRTRELTVASAGHNPMVLWRAATQKHELVRPNGIALGFDRGPVFDRTIREQRLQLQPGDRVVLYTDGVVEAMNEQHEEWGDERLYKFVCEHPAQPSKEFTRLLMRELEVYKGASEQHDDITITTLRVAGGQA